VEVTSKAQHGATNRQHDAKQPKTRMKLKHNNLQTAKKQGSKGTHKQHPNTEPNMMESSMKAIKWTPNPFI
jgi:hypothetical protein